MTAAASPSVPQSPFALDWKAQLILWGFGVSLFVVCVQKWHVITYHESVFTQPAREMLATGDWLIPRVAGVPFLDKPPLTAWMIAGVIALTGSTEEWVVRLPSVFCAALTAWMIALTASRWLGRRVGLLAGLMQLTSYFALQMGTLAEADMPLIAWVTSAYCVFAWANLDAPQGRMKSRWLAPLFGLLAGMAFLTKGPIALFFVYSGPGLYTLVFRQWSALWFLCNPIALLLAGGTAVGYSVLAYRAYPPLLEHWLRHNVGRMHGALGGTQFPFYYAVWVLTALLPWLPFALVALFRERGKIWSMPLTRLILCWFIPGITVLQIITFKHCHYTYPLLPGFTILCAWGMAGTLENPQAFMRWLTAAGALALGAVAVALCFMKIPHALALAAMAALVASALLACVYFQRHAWIGAQIATTFGAVWIVIAAVFVVLVPGTDTYINQTELAERVNAKQPGQPLYLVCFPENQITYYLTVPIRRIDDSGTFLSQLPADEDCRLIGPQWLLDQMRNEGHHIETLDRCEWLSRWLEPKDRMMYAHRIPTSRNVRPVPATTVSQPRP